MSRREGVLTLPGQVDFRSKATVEFFDPDESSSDEAEPPADGLPVDLCSECETMGDCCSLIHTQDWIPAPVDALIGREFATWLPERIFDIHLHCWCNDHFAEPPPALLATVPRPQGVVDWDSIQSFLAPLHCGRPTSGLIFPFPQASLDVRRANEWVVEQVAKDPTHRSRAVLVATPETSAHDLELAQARGIVGLKVYHCFARKAGKPVPPGKTQHATIEQFFPEELAAAAGRLGLSVTLHMVRPRALLDEANVGTIRRYCERYPNLRLILAHAGRGFNMHHTVQAIKSRCLAGLPNLYFDTAAVTESGALEAILRSEDFGPRRLLYGSDFPVSHGRGRCVGIGDSFLWVGAGSMKAEYTQKGSVEAALVGIEALRALKMACDNVGLSRLDIEDIFFRNADELYQIPPPGQEHGKWVPTRPKVRVSTRGR